MRGLLREVLIFSTSKSELSKRENYLAHVEAIEVLNSNGFTYLEVDGYYKGNYEQAILVSKQALGLVVELCQTFKQESYLRREADGSCYLTYLADGREEYLGRWTEVHEGFQGAGFTYDPKSDTYWSAIK